MSNANQTLKNGGDEIYLVHDTQFLHLLMTYYFNAKSPQSQPQFSFKLSENAFIMFQNFNLHESLSNADASFVAFIWYRYPAGMAEGLYKCTGISID